MSDQPRRPRLSDLPPPANPQPDDAELEPYGLPQWCLDVMDAIESVYAALLWVAFMVFVAVVLLVILVFR